MSKVIVKREVLHQAARSLLGTAERGRSTVLDQDVSAFARQLSEATAIPENGPLELVVTE